MGGGKGGEKRTERELQQAHMSSCSSLARKIKTAQGQSGRWSLTDQSQPTGGLCLPYSISKCFFLIYCYCLRVRFHMYQIPQSYCSLTTCPLFLIPEVTGGICRLGSCRRAACVPCPALPCPVLPCPIIDFKRPVNNNLGVTVNSSAGMALPGLSAVAPVDRSLLPFLLPSF